MEKWVVITGANSGIGLATAQRLARTGQYRLILTARHGKPIPLPEGSHTRLDLDLTDADAIQQAADAVLTLTDGKLCALFNNAGYGLQMAMEDVPIASLREQLETNLLGPVHLTQLLLPALIAYGDSRLIFNSSALGYAVMPFRGPYCASKYALEAVADAWRMELVHTGVKVSLLEPGPIKARFRENARQKLEQHQAILARSRLSYSGLLARLSKEYGSGTLDAEVVADGVKTLLESSHPAPRYRFTGSAKFAYLVRMLPTRLKDWIFAKGEPVSLA